VKDPAIYNCRPTQPKQCFEREQEQSMQECSEQFALRQLLMPRTAYINTMKRTNTCVSPPVQLCPAMPLVAASPEAYTHAVQNSRSSRTQTTDIWCITAPKHVACATLAVSHPRHVQQFHQLCCSAMSYPA
jgi:hypothetical protein